MLGELVGDALPLIGVRGGFALAGDYEADPDGATDGALRAGIGLSRASFVAARPLGGAALACCRTPCPFLPRRNGGLGRCRFRLGRIEVLVEQARLRRTAAPACQ